MPFLTIRGFQGIDRRIPRGAGQPQRMWTAENVYVLPGGRIRRRPPQLFWHKCSLDIKGLAYIGGKLRGWHDRAQAPAADEYPPAADYTLHEAKLAGHTLQAVPFAEVVNGKLFVVAEFTRDADGEKVVRYFVDGAVVTSASVPNSPVVALAASRIFAADGEVVRFCKAGDPTDWEGVDDAGFLPTGRQAGGQEDIQAIAGWRSMLAVVYRTQVQIWRVGLDPVTDHELAEVVSGTGTEHPGSVVAMGDMVVYRAPEGYRAIAANDYGRPVLAEVGEAIDDLLSDPDRGEEGAHDAGYSVGLGQYLTIRNQRNADVMQWSRDSGLMAWTAYSFPSPVMTPVNVGDRLYLRNADTGAIVYMTDKMEQGTVFRDETGRLSEEVSLLGTQALFDAAFTSRDGPAPGFFATGGNGRTDDGPSLDSNRSPFASLPVLVPSGEAQPAVLQLAPALLDPDSDVEGSLQVVIDYAAAGDFAPGAGAWLEGSRSVAGEGEGDWQRLAELPGWPYAPRRRKGDEIVDVRDRVFYAIDDGGWRRFRVPLRTGWKRLRLRVADESAAPPGFLVGAAWLERRVDEDRTFPYLSSRARLPARQPTNLSAHAVFLAGKDGPEFYVPDPAGADVPAKTEGSAVPADDQREHTHQVGRAGTWDMPGQSMASVVDLDAVVVATDLVFTVGADGFVPAGDLPFAPAVGTRWWESFAVSLSAYYDRAANEYQVVSSNGRLFNLALGQARLTVLRYDAGTGAAKDSLTFDVPVVDTYEAAVGQFHLVADATGGKWYLLAESSRMVHRFTRDLTAAAQARDADGAFALPVGTSLTAGMTFGEKSVFWTTWPDRQVYRRGVDAEAWRLAVADVRDELQGRAALHFAPVQGGRLYAYDFATRTLRAWWPLPDPGGVQGQGRQSFNLRRIAVRETESLPYLSRMALAFAQAGAHGMSMSKKRWQGVRLEQDGDCLARLAVRGADGGVRHVPPDRRVRVRGDTTSGGMTAFGAVSAEAALDVEVDGDGEWQLSAVGLQVQPLGEWA